MGPLRSMSCSTLNSAGHAADTQSQLMRTLRVLLFSAPLNASDNSNINLIPSVRLAFPLRKLYSISWPVAVQTSYFIVVETRWCLQLLLLCVERGALDITPASPGIFQAISKEADRTETLGVKPNTRWSKGQLTYLV